MIDPEILVPSIKESIINLESKEKKDEDTIKKLN